MMRTSPSLSSQDPQRSVRARLGSLFASRRDRRRGSGVRHGALVATLLLGGSRHGAAPPTVQVMPPLTLPRAAGVPPVNGTGEVPVSLLTVQGALIAALKAQVATATALGRTPFIELGTAWCPRCQTFDRSLTDPRMHEALAGAYIIRLDLDDWDDGLLRQLQFPSDSALLVLFPVDAQGRPTGPTLTTHAWAADRPEVMAPPLTQFIRTQERASALGRATTATGGADSSATIVALSKPTVFTTAVGAEVAKATALGRIPLFEASELGCGACDILDQAISGQSTPDATDAFAGTYIIRSEENWGDQTYRAMHIAPITGYPTLLRLDRTGTVTGCHSGAPDTVEEWRQLKRFISGQLTAADKATRDYVCS